MTNSANATMTLRTHINILWFDDELEERRSWFSRVKDYVKTEHPEVCWLEVTSVQRFAQELQARAWHGPEHPDYIDWIWLDVMLKQSEFNATLHSLGFPAIQQNPLLAGAQILQLMQGEDSVRRQPNWLQAYRGRKTSLLTSISDIRSEWLPEVDEDIRENTNLFSVLVKNLQFATNIVEPDDALKSHLRERLASISDGLKSATQQGPAT